jgi:type VI secretion system protein ImpG
MFKAFLEELQALESFRMAYVAENPGAPLQPDDPDVRRLVEALAFFGARARQAATTTLVEQRRRLFRQFMPYLLDPLPAMGMVQALPTGQLSEAVELPRGTEMALRDPGDRVAIFRTLRPLRLLPLGFGRLSVVLLADGRLRFLLPATTSYPRNDDIGTLSIHVNYLNDFNGSLRVLHALERHVDRVAVSFDERVDAETRGAECQLTFGDGDEAADDAGHPLEEARRYFHFPRAELFFDVTLPPPPRNWQRFTLMFDVKPDWPKNLRLSSEVFQLFVTPIVNLMRATAQPIVHDGTQERWPLRHPAPAGRYELHSVRGVYRRAGEGLVPLKPATLASGAGTYELDGRALLMHLPEALTAPALVSVEAEWLQPWFSTAIGQRLGIAPYRRAVAGVQWDLSGDMVAHREAALGDNGDDFTHILVLQQRSMLGREDLDALLQVLGSVWTGPFAPLRELIGEVRVHEAPAARCSRTATGKLVYELGLKEHEPGLGPLAQLFAKKVERILNAWIAELPVEVRLGAGS